MSAHFSDTIAYIMWDVNPVMLDLGILQVRWYGLMFVFTFFFGYLIIRQMFRVEGKDESRLDNIAIWIMIAAVVGGRLGHTLFYEPEYYLRYPVEILMIWQGGMASHGAVVSIPLTLWWLARKEKLSFWWLADRLSIPAALAGFFIRTGNLMNSEIIGRPTELPWGFMFIRHDNVPRHPAQLYEAIAYLLIFIFLYMAYRRKKAKTPQGFIFGMFLTLVFGARILIEFLKEPQVAFEQYMALNMGQLMSIPLVIAGIVLLWRSKRVVKANSAQV